MREEELNSLTSLHAATKAASDKRIAELEARSSRLAESNRQLELRRQLDADGWAADVAMLRKRVSAVDRKLLQMRLIDRRGGAGRCAACFAPLHSAAQPRAGSQHARITAAQAAQALHRVELRPKQKICLLGARAACVPGPLLRLIAPLRLEDDERLDTLLDQLQRKVPGVQRPGGAARRLGQPAMAAQQQLRLRGSSAGARWGGEPCDEWGGELEAGCSGGVEGVDDYDDMTPSEASTMKGQLAAEMRAVRRQLEDLGGRAAAKARRAGVVPHAPEYGRSPRRPVA